MAVYPSSGPDIVRLWSSAAGKIQKEGAGLHAAGRTNIASGLFANGRGQRKGGTGLGL
jgi:hypothetical protein